jgi:hypothetical protein
MEQPWLKHGWIKQKRIFLEGQSRAELALRFWADAGFRERLLADPRAALNAEFGLALALPPGLRIRVIVDAPGEWTLTIPHMPEESRPRRSVSGEEGKLESCTTVVFGFTVGCTGTC